MTRSILAIAAGVGIAAGTPAAAQTATPSQGTHKHYEPAPDAAKAGPNGELAPRLQQLGTHTFPVTTARSEAQRFVDQGVKLAYAFNHAEAGRAFRESARLDPDLAMAYWGQALVLGPNINAAMEAGDEPAARALADQAMARAGRASPRERALIDALSRRYTGRAADRAAGDRAYADAMRAVHRRFPDDLDIAMLYVEAMMDLRPWNYWTPDGRPQAGTAEIVALTEDVLRRDPQHPAANHLLIHLVEATADRLWLAKDGAVNPYDGDLEDYKTLVTGVSGDRRGKREAEKASKADRRRDAAARRAAFEPLAKEIRATEALMDRIRKRIDGIEDELANPAIYEKDPSTATRLAKERSQLAQTLAGHEEKWLSMSAEYEEGTAE